MRSNQKFKGHIRKLIDSNFLFSSFKLPNEKKIRTIIQKSQQIRSFEDCVINERSGFIMHPFNEETSPVIWIDADQVVVDDNFENLTNGLESRPSAFSFDHSANSKQISKETYLIKVRSLIEELKGDHLSKVVFSRFINFSSREIDVVENFLNLVEKFPETFVFLVNIPGEEVWLGASPESLVRIKGKNASTMALAGTQYGQNAFIGWREKEVQEQAFVQKHIEKCLMQNGIKFEKAETTTKTLSSGLSHLITPYSFSVEKSQTYSLIQSLHPTPAICGHPTEKAKSWILKNEGYDRKYYTGFLGPMNIEDSSDLFVNLRSASFGDETKLYVGGGIIKTSDEEKEWKESEQKSRTILDVVESEVKL